MVSDSLLGRHHQHRDHDVVVRALEEHIGLKVQPLPLASAARRVGHATHTAQGVGGLSSQA